MDLPRPSVHSSMVYFKLVVHFTIRISQVHEGERAAIVSSLFVG